MVGAQYITEEEPQTHLEMAPAHGLRLGDGVVD